MYLRRGDSGDELGPVLGDAFVFVFPAHHEARDVLRGSDRTMARRRHLWESKNDK